MKIGIDVSQLAYGESGVAKYLENLLLKMLEMDQKNEYILFFSSLRRNIKYQISKIKKINRKVKITEFKLPQSGLRFIWNKLHVIPIEWFVGKVDWFITSDWTEPPSVSAKKATILYDLVVYKYPKETDNLIVENLRYKLEWVKRESEIIFCISESTKKDTMDILGIEEKRLKVIFPGLTK